MPSNSVPTNPNRKLTAIPADLVLSATPIDLTRVLTVPKPIVRVRYELEPQTTGLDDALLPIISRAREALVGAR